ncbi:MAG TPA: PBP1A family penicillin-binding protein [Pyrinomonadaceae bacterium]|nr:PBP1A family penicillin-binding protein [Pyrinomonadaceae bacterium]
MAIEVTSVPDRRWAGSIPTLARKYFNRRKRQIVLHSFGALVVIALVAGGDYLLRSYKFYSRMIDARIAHGYLTSRPGLYAAPRTIRVGQGFSRDELINALRRAGYIESNASDVWSGSFTNADGAVEIRAAQRPDNIRPEVVRVRFAGERIDGLSTNGVSLESFTLEPEVLTNDVATKNGRRKALAYKDLPRQVVQAILAIEDRRFFEHSGVDVFAIVRALAHNANAEQIKQGGSTITQQLVKNTYLTPERTFRRKYAEAMLALALERQLSKEDILALYCNEIYLGQRGAIAVRGVEQAAQIYFGKQLSDLSLSEAATIAGMIQGPARYSPQRHPEAAKARRNLVLSAMAAANFISEAEALSAAGEELSVAPVTNQTETLAPYFVDFVNRVAGSQLDLSGETKLHTTIDLDLQRLAETALERQLSKIESRSKKTGARPQAALVALDPKTGNVLAMYGGRDYAQTQLNRATDARRQPGSTFKPFVYAAALETGLSPLRIFTDAPREFVYDNNRVYRPSNYGGGYSMNEVTMRTALVKSLNVVTVDVAMQTGLARIANMAARFGLPKPERYPALALGTTEVTPLELAAAYAAFINGGRRVVPRVITSVSDTEPSATSVGPLLDTQAIKPTTAYMITNMLAAVIDHGTAGSARGTLKGTAIAGKTGTSRDGWFVGYTPNFVCVVWVGFDDNSQLGLTGAEAALPAWVEFMEGAVALRPELGGRSFLCPEGIKFVEVDTENGLLSTLTCPSRALIAITENVAPNYECHRHGNLPAQNDYREVDAPFARKPAFPTFANSPAVASRASSTGVNIDVNGKRTLVNEMR